MITKSLQSAVAITVEPRPLLVPLAPAKQVELGRQSYARRYVLSLTLYRRFLLHLRPV